MNLMLKICDNENNVAANSAPLTKSSTASRMVLTGSEIWYLVSSTLLKKPQQLIVYEGAHIFVMLGLSATLYWVDLAGTMRISWCIGVINGDMDANITYITSEMITACDRVILPLVSMGRRPCLPLTRVKCV